MKEFRFKILEEGDYLHTFSETSMVIKKKNGEYHIYKITGFAEGAPTFDKNFRLVLKNGIGKIEVHDSETEITILI